MVGVSPAAQAVSVAQPQDDGTSCTGPDGYRVELPAGWSTNDAGVLPACSWFGPGEVVVPEASDVRTAPVTLRVVDAPLAEAAVPMPDEVGRTELVVGGRQAVRIEQVTTLGLYPAGTRITTWALDLDGDGVREVHCNTLEGLWTGLRNFLRPFRGVSKWYLAQYVAVFQWAHNLKRVTDEFLLERIS